MAFQEYIKESEVKALRQKAKDSIVNMSKELAEWALSNVEEHGIDLLDLTDITPKTFKNLVAKFVESKK